MGLGLALISALADQAEFTSPSDGGTEVRMRFRRTEDASEDSIPRAHEWAARPPDLSGDVVLRCQPVTLLRHVLGRVARAIAASSHFTLSGAAELYAINDAVADYAEAAADGHVVIAISGSSHRLTLDGWPFIARDGVGADVTALPAGERRSRRPRGVGCAARRPVELRARRHRRSHAHAAARPRPGPRHGALALGARWKRARRVVVGMARDQESLVGRSVLRTRDRACDPAPPAPSLAALALAVRSTGPRLVAPVRARVPRLLRREPRAAAAPRDGSLVRSLRPLGDPGFELLWRQGNYSLHRRLAEHGGRMIMTETQTSLDEGTSSEELAYMLLEEAQAAVQVAARGGAARRATMPAR